MIRENGAGLEDLIDRIEEAYLEFPEPKEWMRQTNQVLESYKNEVELLRKDLRQIRTAITVISKQHRELMGTAKDSNKALRELTDAEAKLAGK